MRVPSEPEPPRGSSSADPPPGHFPVALRGYDRDAVDAYVANLRQRVIELEAVRTPESIMRRALEQVGQETSGILQQAQETAREIAARSRQQADDRLARAKRDADEIRVSSELRLRQMDADTDVIWRERAALLDDVRRIAAELLETTERADKRYPPEDDTGSGRTGAMEALPPGSRSGDEGAGEGG